MGLSPPSRHIHTSQLCLLSLWISLKLASCSSSRLPNCLLHLALHLWSLPMKVYICKEVTSLRYCASSWSILGANVVAVHRQEEWCMFRFVMNEMQAKSCSLHPAAWFFSTIPCLHLCFLSPESLDIIRHGFLTVSFISPYVFGQYARADLKRTKLKAKSCFTLSTHCQWKLIHGRLLV